MHDLFKLAAVSFLKLIFLSTHSHASEDLSNINVITSIYEPYSYSNNGRAEGIAVDRARKIFAQLDFAPDIEVYPWARAYNLASTTPNSLIFSMARTSEREKLFYWIGEILEFNVYLYKKKTNISLVINTIEDLKKYQIGALVDDVKGIHLRKLGIKTFDLSSEENGMGLVMLGRLDLIPVDASSLKFRLKKLNLPEDALTPTLHLTEISKPLYLAMHKDTPIKLVNIIKRAYDASQLLN